MKQARIGSVILPLKVKIQNRTGAKLKSAATAESPAGMSGALKELPVNLAVLDARGIIVDVNEAWKTFARDNGLRTPNFGIGKNYRNYADQARGAGRISGKPQRG